MLKQEFLSELSRQLCHLKPYEIENAVNYHSGIIDGRMENGMSEEQAVAAFGDVSHAALEFIRSGSGKDKHRISNKIKAMPTVTRLISSTVLIFICYLLVIALWVVVSSVCAAFAVLTVGGVLGIISGIVMIFMSNLPVGLCIVGAAMVVTSISILILSPTRALCKIAVSFCSFINGKIRALLAKEALAV